MTNEKKQVPAYLVCSSIMPEGHGSLDAYGEAVHPIMDKFGGELIVGGMSDQEMIQLEGKWPNKDAKFTLFKFPSKQHLLDFWNSEEYQSVKHLRTDVIKANFTFIVEGYDGSSYDFDK